MDAISIIVDLGSRADQFKAHSLELKAHSNKDFNLLDYQSCRASGDRARKPQAALLR